MRARRVAEQCGGTRLEQLQRQVLAQVCSAERPRLDVMRLQVDFLHARLVVGE